MVNVKKGVLVTCDPAMQQFLLYLDETFTLGSKFVIKVVDATHVLVDANVVSQLEEKLEQLLESMSPSDGQ